jgi:hypothetical protein
MLPRTTAGKLSRRHRIVVLAICCTSLLVAMMDNTIVNVSLPPIRADLHASVTGLQWTVDACGNGTPVELAGHGLFAG